MKKVIMLLLSTLISLPSDLWAAEKGFFNGNSASLLDMHLNHEKELDKREEISSESAELDRENSSQKHEDGIEGGQLVLSSSSASSKAFSVSHSLSIKGRIIKFLEVSTSIPPDYKKLIIHNDSYLKELKDSREKMCQIMEREGVKVIQRWDSQDEDRSLLIYSDKYNISFFITEDIRHFLIFSQQFLTYDAPPNAEQIFINRFLRDMNESLCTESTDVLNPREFMDYLDFRKIKRLGDTSPLKCLIDIYKKDKKTVDHIIDQLAACEEKYADEPDNEDFDTETNKIYEQLVEKGIFREILKQKYQEDLEANIEIFALILGWGQLSNSLLLTCCLGDQYEGGGGGIKFYQEFIFPFLESLFMNLKGNFYDITTFMTKGTMKRVHVIKYKIKDLDKSPAFVLRGFRTPPSSEGAVAKKREGGGCLLM